MGDPFVFLAFWFFFCRARKKVIGAKETRPAWNQVYGPLKITGAKNPSAVNGIAKKGGRLICDWPPGRTISIPCSCEAAGLCTAQQRCSDTNQSVAFHSLQHKLTKQLFFRVSKCRWNGSSGSHSYYFSIRGAPVLLLSAFDYRQMDRLKIRKRRSVKELSRMTCRMM